MTKAESIESRIRAMLQEIETWPELAAAFAADSGVETVDPAERAFIARLAADPFCLSRYRT